MLDFKGELLDSVYKFSGLSTHKLACLASNTLWFSNLDDFNDPFEGRVLATSKDDSPEKINLALENILSLFRKRRGVELPGFVHQNDFSPGEKVEIVKFIREMFLTELKEIRLLGVLSLMDSGSEVLVNQHMWSHYADGLRGYCIRFDKQELMSSLRDNNDELYLASINVSYSDALPSIDAIEYFCSFDSRLENAFIRQSLIPRLKIYEAISTKSTSWANENELRLLSGKKGPLRYSGEAIKEIIIGEKMPIDQQSLIARVVKSVSPNAAIKLAAMKKDSYDLSIFSYEK